MHPFRRAQGSALRWWLARGAPTDDGWHQSALPSTRVDAQRAVCDPPCQNGRRHRANHDDPDHVRGQFVDREFHDLVQRHVGAGVLEVVEHEHRAFRQPFVEPAEVAARERRSA